MICILILKLFEHLFNKFQVYNLSKGQQKNTDYIANPI
jgi:hypothetical protein